MKRELYMLLFFTGIIASALTSVNAQWEGWNYRRTVTIGNTSGSDLTDYQVKIDLNNLTPLFNFANAKSDGSDLRITSDDGVTEIPFWIEEWNVSEVRATIWVKVPSIPTSGAIVYLYYGNPTPIPPPDPVETPPVGPFTRAVGNPINPIGDPGSGASLLAENIVYDDVTSRYWMVFANYRGGSQGVGLVWSDTPTDASSWNWYGNIYTHTGGGSFAPHILKEGGLWYIFFAILPNVVYMTSTTIDGIYSTPTVVLSPSETWETYRVDEPYVFQRNDGKWIMAYMGDIGGANEQIGYATADNLTGPYTKYAGNPCLAFGPPGSYDAGTIADPWVYEYYGVYYIGYTVSPTTSSPWQTALATTTDWVNFTKHGVIFPLAASGWDANNSFRGAVTRIGDTYVFSYTGDSYRMGIATQPVFMSPADIINNGDAVFDFFDGFDGTSIDLTKWTFSNGSASQTSVSGGLITLNATGTYAKINAQSSFGMDYMGETRAYHPNQGTPLLIAEVGFEANSWNTVRIVDDFELGTTYWQREAKLTGQSSAFINMAQTADQNWHIFHIYRESPDIAGFQIDDNPVETVNNTSVPTMNLPPFLMSYGNGNQFVVDWTRVRKWAGVDPSTLVGVEEDNPLPVELSSFSASVIGSSVKLSWRTETEVNNYGFDIERKDGGRSSNTLNWEKIGFVNGNGNSNSPKNYVFEDKNVNTGKYSYRLKQIDNDGQFEYSKTIEIDFGAPRKFELNQNYPNPFNPSTRIKYSIPEESLISIKIYNTLGEEIAELVTESKSAGNYEVEFNAEDFSSGVYIYQMKAGDFIDTKKMILLR